MSVWGPHREPAPLGRNIKSFASMGMKPEKVLIGVDCDTCNDDAEVDCHDCELHQHVYHYGDPSPEEPFDDIG
jgi:hypothetical protein